MYTRSPQGRFPRDMRVPSNYAGNAFRPPLSSEDTQGSIFTEVKTTGSPIDTKDTALKTAYTENDPEIKDLQDDRAKSAAAFSFPKLDLSLSNIFSRGRLSLDGEELLILGLILLIASGGKGDDLILLLILLLFIN